ncbi:monocarboxylate transporter 13-like [Paramacrobiotus metropolitanus]|uniref:monocarboxylate transporter 13-like n=1 Tax=Paramacrobiotus metropolitanus TaxID=2943436 RepID=UPI00244589E3|nr:monocarboxylate transporter 13-like [Paramacrobiotus metropolitanus]
MAAAKPIVIVPHNPTDELYPEEEEMPHPYTSRPIGEVQPKKVVEADYDSGRAWLVLAAGFLTNVLVFGVELNFNVFMRPLLEEFPAHDASDVAWIGAISYGVMFLIGPLASLLISRVGTMYAVIISGVLSCLGFLSSRFATDVYYLYISYGLLVGSGMGIAFLSSFAILGDYFKQYIRLASIVVAVGGGVGLFLFTKLFQHFVEDYLGWRDAMLITAGICLNLILLGICMRPRPRDPSVRLPTLTELMATHVLKSSKYLLFLSHVVLWNVGLVIVFILLQKYLSEYKFLDDDQANFVVMMLGIANTVGRVASIPVERVASPMKVYVIMSILMGVFEMLLPSGWDVAGLATISSLLGLSFGIMICYFVAVVGELVGFENLTPALGYSNFAQGIGGLIGPPTLAKLADGSKFIVGGAITVISGLLVLLAIVKHWRDTVASRRTGALSVENGLYNRHSEFDRADTAMT